MINLAWSVRDELKSELLKFIQEQSSTVPTYGPCSPWSKEQEQLAVRISRNQLDRSPLLRHYQSLTGLGQAEGINSIPALPAAAFRGRLILPLDSPKAVFRTSGTTGNETGLHGFMDTDLYDWAAPITFCRYVLGSPSSNWNLVNLLPPPTLAPHSSLVHMMGLIEQRFAPDRTHWLATEGPQLLDEAPTRLDSILRDARGPVVLAGPAFAFVSLIQGAGLMDNTHDRNGSGILRWSLPPGSRIMETGGFKGRTQEIERHQFHQLLATTFGIPRASIINEYGMTELSSQFYDKSLEAGHPSEVKTSAPWLKASVIQPLSGKRCSPGKIGLLRIYDLLNLDSSVAIQTEDRAVETETGGFILLGRVSRAGLRGCSLPYEPGMNAEPSPKN